jgi:nitrogen regulatory protein PII
MTALKKLEIIIEKRDLQKVLDVLEELEVPLYYVIKDVTGKDPKGIKHGDDLNDVFKNCIVTTITTPELIEQTKVRLNEVFTKWSGICIVYHNVEAMSDIR